MDNKTLTETIQTAVREEMAPIIKRLDGLEQKQDAMQNDMAAMRESLDTVRLSQMRMELEWLPKISAALDGVLGAIQKSKEQDLRLLTLENTVNRHDAEIASLMAKP